ncbi:MAG: hypothetical protein IKA88_04610 [Clostridia bacterium]|nr:hypothetical protein [Clostridia bacterium]
MKMKKKELLKEMRQLFLDEFVAKVTEENESLVLSFFNGQQYIVTVQEK